MLCYTIIVCLRYSAVRVFGRGFSGLLYDYQGLIHLYENSNREELALYYTNELSTWSEMYNHETSVEATSDPLEFLVNDSVTVSDSDGCSPLIQRSYELCPPHCEEDSILNRNNLASDWSTPKRDPLQSSCHSANIDDG